MAKVVHAKAGQIRSVQDAMKDSAQMAFLSQPPSVAKLGDNLVEHSDVAVWSPCSLPIILPCADVTL